MAKYLRINLIVFIFASFGLHAQVGPMFSQYMFNKMIYNPAAAGIDTGYISAKGFYQDQWTSFHDPQGASSPIAISGSVDAPIYFKPSTTRRFYLGLGLSFSNFSEGFLTQDEYMVSASCHYLPSFGGDLSLGINGGETNIGFKPQWFTANPQNPFQPIAQSKNGFDGGAGLFYSTKDYFIGISALNMFSTRLQWIEYPSYFTLAPTYTLSSGYNIEINHNKDLVLQPSFLYENNSDFNLIAITTLFLYKQRFWAGLNYKDDYLKSMAVMAGAVIVNARYGDLSMGASYNIASNVAPAFGEALELMLNARVKI